MPLSRDEIETLVVALCSRSIALAISDAIDAAEVDPLSLRKDGLNSPTADIGWGGFKITGLAAPVASSDAANKAYVDAAGVPSIHLDGSNSPTANISWNSKKITNLLNPTAAQDAATKDYVDNSASAGANIRRDGTNSPTANIDWGNFKLSNVSRIEMPGNNTIVGGNIGIPSQGANTFVGYSAGEVISSGGANTFIGNSAGRRLTTGNQNTYLGNEAGAMATTGSNNTILGALSGGNFGGVSATASDNTLVGKGIMTFMTSGSRNVIVGHGAGALIQSGSDNTIIGRNAGAALPSSTTGTIVIGSGASVGSSNELAIGTYITGNSALVKISGSRQLVLETAQTPASASAAGTTGEVRWDSDFVYVCVATNTWKRSAIATW